MTRTICLGEPAEERMSEIHDSVLKAMKTCEAGIHAGMTGKEPDALARDVLEAAGLGEYSCMALVTASACRYTKAHHFRSITWKSKR